MRKSIWKFPLKVEDNQSVFMPKGAEILTVQAQGGNPCIWALVNTEEPDEEQRLFQIFGTGHPVSDNIERKYINTFQVQEGTLVFHVFEITK